tara:strand:- start:371 stop:547 length:177 start_codon:yes stop_codon:yes gene_type:complete
MPEDLDKLVELAKQVTTTGSQQESQRRSFAFGNTHLENPAITREIVDQQAESLKRKNG